MQITSNIEELIAKFTRLATAAQTLDVSAALTIGVNSARTMMLNRIHNQGLDAELRSLGKYTGGKTRITNRKYNSYDDGVEDANVRKLSKKKLTRLKKNAEDTGEEQFSEYEKERLSKGRQIAQKDMEFSGETRRALKTQSTENGVYAGFDNTKNANIAQYQEEQIGKIRGTKRVKIWALADNERAVMKKETNAALNQLYVSLFNG